MLERERLTMNNIFFIIIAVVLIIYIITSVRMGRLSVSASFGWVLASLAMLILAIFPKSLDWLAVSLGIEYPPALFLTLCVVLLFTISFNYSKKIAQLQSRVTDLAQEVSILKSVNEKDGKK